ncbi:MAG: exonuclease SbcCD subunit D [Elainellaceae cyanobacterium]
MARFLHIADIHLGFNRYDCPERTKDFFYTLYAVLQTHAVEAKVDFVAIAGDLFEHRNIQPAILNQAQKCLQLLQDANIPAIAIEGNHDNRPYGTNTNWLRYLADWGLLILLEPTEDAEVIYQPWDPKTRRGGYIDLDCGVRVLGSHWYGAAAPSAIGQLAEAIAQLPKTTDHTVMLFHHGLEGQVARYAGALRYGDLAPLKQAGVDYLALGHIHKHYCVEDWIFNPGSLEANSIEESSYVRGAYAVELGPEGICAELRRSYRQRAVVRLKLQTRGQETADELAQAAQELVTAAIAGHKLNPQQQPITELRIEGTVGFDPLELDVRQLQGELQEMSQSLIFLLRYAVDAVAYQTPLQDGDRQQIEQETYRDLVVAHNSYKRQADRFVTGLVGLQEMTLEERADDELYQFLETLLDPASPSTDP